MVKRSRENEVNGATQKLSVSSSDGANGDEISQPVFSAEISRISSCFSVLETILLSFKTRNIIPKWCDVHDACAAINSTTVTLSEVCSILRVFPTAYKLTWQQAGQFSTATVNNDNFELIITLNLSGITGNVLKEFSARKLQFE